MKNRLALISIAALLIALVLSACDIKSEGGSTAVRFQQEHEECLEKIEKELAGYGKQIEELYAQAERTAGDARDEINKTISDLRKKQRKAVRKYEELTSATNKTWKNMQRRVKQSRKDLEDTYEKALALFHEIT